MRNRLGFLVLATAMGIAALAVMAQEAATPGPRVVEMTAGNYEFTPSSVHVKVGEAVEIKVTADDKEHGIRIKTVAKGRAKGSEPGIEITSGSDCVKFKKNETGTIVFTAKSPGTYEFECCKLCGFDHGKMKGEIVVDP
ncbi:MAG: cupredoxin domain-containing protein [Candidatus Acidiferrales bacterium]|jgi:heme/copper-type cytochrome/quinol oxidase subunit 2